MAEKIIDFIDIFNLDDKYKARLMVWRNQDFVRKMMFRQTEISEEEHFKYLETLNRKSRKIYAAFYKEQPFGILQFDIFYSDSNLEFGYYLIDSKYMNSGLGIILEYALLEHAFNVLGVNKVFCRTLAFNKKVIELHSKFGFMTEGILKEHVKIENGYADICFQSIFADSWQKNKAYMEKIINVILPLSEIGIIN